jgi:hypothetical protein
MIITQAKDSRLSGETNSVQTFDVTPITQLFDSKDP